MFIKYTMLILTILGLASALRAILGPTIWDRLIGLSLVSSKITMLIILYAILTEQSYIIDTAMVYVLLGFISMIYTARFIQEKGRV
ncbi:multisubunit sodium/proton antiporter, MrpF subunit [Clostridium aceticum]|uniref:Multisubunit sodium/proton antiporter, MrpF subunit n=1 Tax=Clostridium aceticum TaxID=84022 RepID=A0A0D8IAX1_9CLOT|nr:monovalent cation/H+ antiporter complex subunit F [Clostridium aceticum]AKL96418.1 multisubunit sodium/proton antiporter, MrpF subunit [Clostridium aceticum]KJF27403.1 pH regulation protein F [Clostridium aceticum]